MTEHSTTEVAHDRRVADELRMLYTTALTEIAGFKQQQWHITNYGMLIYAALVSVSRLLHAPVTVAEKGVLTLVALVVCGAGWGLIRMFHQSIDTRRKRLTYLRSHAMTAEAVTAWRAGKPPGAMPDVPEERTQLEPFFRAVFLIGLAAVLWLLWQ